MKEGDNVRSILKLIFLIFGVFIFTSFYVICVGAVTSNINNDDGVTIKHDSMGYYLDTNKTISYDGLYAPTFDKVFLLNHTSNHLIEINDATSISNYSWELRGMIRHERCHQNQHYNKEVISEFECYFKQLFGGI